MTALQVPFDDYGDWLNLKLRETPANDVHIACERFIISSGTVRKSADAHWAIEAQGITRYLAHCFDCDFILHPASAAKSYASDAQLRTAGWYVAGKPHANDALRHMALMLAKLTQQLPTWYR